MSAPTDRIPPQSIEAEQAVIASAIISPAAADRASDIVTEADFYRPAHRLLWRIVEDLRRASRPADLVAICELLTERQQYDVIGGMPYLTQLTEAVPTAANVEYYARTVADRATRRRLIAAGEKIAAIAHEVDANNLEETLQAAESTLADVTRSSTGDQTVTSGELMDAVSADMDARANGETPKRWFIEVKDLDEMLHGLRAGQYVVVAARTTMGKSAFAIGMARAFCGQGARVLFVSLEMTALEVGQRLLAQHAPVSLATLRIGATMNASEYTAFAAARSEIAGWSLTIADCSGLTPVALARNIRRANARDQLDVVFVDHLHLMRPDVRTDSQYVAMGEISRSLKEIAKKHRVLVVALAQLNRQADAREDKQPCLSDLRESGRLEEDADAVIGLYRQDYYKREEHERPPETVEAKALVLKNRNGPTGRTTLVWRPRYARFDPGDPFK